MLDRSIAVLCEGLREFVGWRFGVGVGRVVHV